MKVVVWIIVAIFATALSIWIAQNFDAPWYCEQFGWLKYDRSCSAWTFFGNN